jgi:CRISPR/Cas system CSM-associated protein Csm2 small subunit
MSPKKLQSKQETHMPCCQMSKILPRKAKTTSQRMWLKHQAMKIAQVMRTRLCSSRLSRSLYERMTNIKEKERRGHAMNVAKPVTSLRIVQTRRNKMTRKITKGTC